MGRSGLRRCALPFLNLTDSHQVKFQQRIQKWRAQHDARIDQLTNQLFRLRREAENRERYEDRLASRPPHQVWKPKLPGIDYEPKGNSLFTEQDSAYLRTRLERALQEGGEQAV